MAEPRLKDLEGLKKKFRNFDNPEVYGEVCRAGTNPLAQNFVVLFGPAHAKVATDLGEDDFESLLTLKDAECPVRWINFWNTSKQAAAIQTIGSRYGFSRRLRASMTEWDTFRSLNKAADVQKRVLKELKKAEEEHGSAHIEKTDDLEMNLNGETKQEQVEIGGVDLSAPGEPPSEAKENFRVLQNSLNYTTTDYGPDCEYLLTNHGICLLTSNSSLLFRRKLAARAASQ